MKRIMMIIWTILTILIVVAIAARVAPSDPDQWHVATQAREDKDFKSGAIRLVNTGPDGLARLNEIALATARTSVLAGSVDSGMVTYITRTAVFGFPDYTTVQQDGETLKFHARLRFGRSDTGVNRERLKQWIAALQL
jgi:uncharacterized protein (DUF1499 family)